MSLPNPSLVINQLGKFRLFILLAVVSLNAAGCLHTMEAIDPRMLPIVTTEGQRLKDHVSFLAGPDLKGRQPGSVGNRQAAQYIEDQFRAVGLQPLPSLGLFRQIISPQIGDNVVGMIPPAAAVAPARWILIGAHYDHLGYPFLGADDNASSVAILIETARQMADRPSHYGIIFVAFNSEESPYFGRGEMGSQFFFHHLPPEIGSQDHIQAAIIMDLMGGVHWPPLKDAIFATGGEKSPDFYERIKNTKVPFLNVFPVGIHLVEEIPDIGHKAFSDYDVFRNHKVPFLFLSAGRTPRYHTAGDVASTLHYDRMAATVDWLRRLAAGIDLDMTPYTFNAQQVAFADEVAIFSRIAEQAAQSATAIPDTSRLSLFKLKKDVEWLRTVDTAEPTPEKLDRLERISIRVQCLLADYSGCFML